MINSHTYKTLAGPVLILVMLTLVALFTRPLTPIDETRYLSVAWEMWEKSDYLVLFKNGEPYSHKPPMLFWLYNLGWGIFGINEWWPRLVSPLFSLGSIALIFSISRRLWPEQLDVQANALWILSGSLLWTVFSTIAMFDAMLAFFVLLGIRGLLIAADESMNRGFSWLGLSIGLGVLAKGPVVLLHLLPVAVLAPWWRRNLDWKRWYGSILLAVAFGAAIALAWAIPAALRGGEEYRNAIFWGQTANRMVESFAHRRPMWWYVPLLPVFLFPWLLWPGFWRKLLALKNEGLNDSLRFCLAWIVPVFLAFSLISGKQPHYLVPLMPAFALVFASVLRNPKDGLWLPALLMAILGGAMIYLALSALPVKQDILEHLQWWPGFLLIAGALVVAWAGKETKRRVPSLAVLGAMAFASLQLYFTPIAWSAYDVHPMAHEIAKLQQQGKAIANLKKYHAQFQFAGRLAKPIVELKPDELPAWVQKHPDGVVVVYVKSDRLPARSLFSQPFRGGVAVLLNAEQAVAQINLIVGKDDKSISLPEGGED